jgi:acetyl-CoA carboxylase biotin carboxyl carrier protein
MQLDDEDVRAILQLLDAATFDELQIETDRFNLTLRRNGAAWTRESRTLGVPREWAPSPGRGTDEAGAGEATDTATPTVTATEAVTATPTAVVGGASELDRLVAVQTPLPGTFYRSPRPGAPPFVEVGARVEHDTVVAIVETMKLMNSVYAGSSGRIAEICCADAAVVAQQAVLMRIDPEVP